MSNNRIIDKMSLNQFIAMHSDYYRDCERDQLMSCTRSSSFEYGYKADGIREVFDQLGLIPEDQNLYIAFMNLLEKEFGLEGKNIVEVGGGILPRLARRINMKQKNGTITVYDPRLGMREQGNERLILKREKFNQNTPVQDADLIIGLMPCEGAVDLIESAAKNNKDFMIWLCEGGYLNLDYDIELDEVLGSNISLAERRVEENKMGKLYVKRIPELSHFPIIYNHR